MQDSLKLEGASAPPSALRRMIDALAPAARDPRDREFLRDLALLGSMMFLVTAVAYLATSNWTLPFPATRPASWSGATS